MFEIHVGELRATFLRNHNMRRRKDPTRKTVQAEDNSSTEDPRNPDSRHNRHKHGGAAPDMGRCTRYVAVHPLCGGAPEQKRCIAYGSGAVPQQTRTNAELARRTTHRRTPPCAAGPYRWQDGHAAHAAHAAHVAHAAHAATCTPAHSNTSHTLKCEEPDLDPNYTPNYEEPLFVKAVGHSRQRRWRRPTRMMETSSCWDRIPILLRSGGVFGPAKARSWIG